MSLVNLNLEAAALGWLRVEKRCKVVTTEAGHWYADVLGATDLDLYEIEVKRTVSDMLRDFKEKNKHKLYTSENGGLPDIPNYFYFLVPLPMKEKALAILKTVNPKYGLLCHDLEGTGHWGISSGKRAYRIHEIAPTKRTLDGIMYRMCNELVNLYLFNSTVTYAVENLRSSLDEATGGTAEIGEHLQQAAYKIGEREFA